jgi:hypothetical protein
MNTEDQKKLEEKMQRYRQQPSQQDKKKTDDTTKHDQAVAKFGEVVKETIRTARRAFVSLRERRNRNPVA